MDPVNFARLPTEQNNPRSRQFDRLSSLEIVRLMNREDRQVIRAIHQAQRPIARAIDLIVRGFRRKGRLIFFGAGTSGRLGVIEAAECPPTFNTPAEMVQAVMAGGASAVFQSKEGAEDSAHEAISACLRIRPGGKDVILGIAASGITPFVQAALLQSKSRGARTILLTCNPRVTLSGIDLVIRLNTGAEVLAGSTRLKAGSACKMVLNILSTGAMVRLGKVYGNRMVDLQPKSRKLVERGIRLIQELGEVSEPVAQELMRKAKGHVKPAILMARNGLNYSQAERRLITHQGSLRQSL